MIAGTLALTALLAAASTQADDDAPGTWRFRDDSKPVKVVVLAGSIGAYQRNPYHRRIAEVCANVEVKNLSKTGAGAWPLKQHFKKQVLQNKSLDLEADGIEPWLLMGASVNSIGSPRSTNNHMKNTVVLAKMAGMKVVGLSPPPWGSNKDSRFDGLEGLARVKSTRLVTDWMLGTLTAAEALGQHAQSRPAGVDGDWVDLERYDIAVDLYDSPMRDTAATPRDLEKMEGLLAKNRQWAREHADLDEEAMATALAADAQLASEVPQWFMRKELHAFDHIHPNEEGHRIIAEVTCPSLPASWGCDCSALSAAAAPAPDPAQ